MALAIGKVVEGNMRWSPHEGLSTGKGMSKVVMCPHKGSDTANGHPMAQQLVLVRVTPPPACGISLDTPTPSPLYLPRECTTCPSPRVASARGALNGDCCCSR